MLDKKKLFLNKSSVNKLMKGLVNIHQEKSNHISIPFISKPFIFELIEQASILHFRKARALVGNSVTQDFEICFPAPRDGAIDILATSIERLFLEAINSLHEPPIKGPKFNESMPDPRHFLTLDTSRRLTILDTWHPSRRMRSSRGG